MTVGLDLADVSAAVERMRRRSGSDAAAAVCAVDLEGGDGGELVTGAAVRSAVAQAAGAVVASLVNGGGTHGEGLLGQKLNTNGGALGLLLGGREPGELRLGRRWTKETDSVARRGCEGRLFEAIREGIVIGRIRVNSAIAGGAGSVVL